MLKGQSKENSMLKGVLKNNEGLGEQQEEDGNSMI